MTENALVIERHDGVTLWRLNNPALRNPFTAELKQAMAEQAALFVVDDAQKCLVITGNAECFCAGGDIRTMDADRSTVAVRKRLQHTHRWMKLLVNSEKPVIMAVNGAAVGAGVSLALAGDIAVASDKAFFMSGFPKVGVLPDLALLYTLPRAIGMQRAKDFLMTSRKVEATEALSIGLVSRVFPHAEFHDKVLAMAKEIANGPLVSIGLTKSLLNQTQNDSLESFLLREEMGQAVVFGTEDFMEGNRAFKEKRSPRFSGK